MLMSAKNNSFTDDDVKFKAPFTCLVAGPTGSGKTFFTFRLITHREEMIIGDVSQVIYCLPEGQIIKVPDYIRNDKDVQFHYGMPDLTKFTSGRGCLLILDDMMSDINSEVMNMFSRHSHHKNVSVVLLVQNVFYGGNKFFRTISLNSHYIVCTKNPRDRQQINTLAQQLSPENVKFVKEAYADATSRPYQYLLCDLSQKCPDQLRFRTSIFPDDKPRNIIYVSST